jgi:uncharacterized membrane protein
MVQIAVAVVVSLATEKIRLTELKFKSVVLFLTEDSIHTDIAYVLYFPAISKLKEQTIADLSKNASERLAKVFMEQNREEGWAIV